MRIRIYDDITVPANANAGVRDVAIPQGNWRIVSVMALANLAGGTVTSDVEAMITLNETDRLRATDTGSVGPFIFGGVLSRATATKKISLGDVFVRVIITLEQA